jgi:hypothetical protein
MHEGRLEFRQKTAGSLHRCAMITMGFFDTLSDFAQILALCRAPIITIPTIHTSSYYSAEDNCMVRLVIIRARQRAKIRAKTWYFTS